MPIKPSSSRAKSRTKAVKETVAIALKKPTKAKSKSKKAAPKKRAKSKLDKSYMKLVLSR